MDSQYLSQHRQLLQRRIQRLNSCNHQLFHSGVVHFWAYLETHQIFGGVIAQLDASCPDHANKIHDSMNGEVPTFETEEQSRSFTFRLLQHCARVPIAGGADPELDIGVGLGGAGQIDTALDNFRETYLGPFHDYLDEVLDQSAAVLSLLLKYKRKVEWFERDAMATLALNGERALAEHMYGYLFDQGLDFQIEPKSISGEADLVAKDLVLDVKVFDGKKRSLTYIRNGLHQLLTYARDFHQATGFLVIYHTCPEDLQFGFDRPDSLVPFVRFDGRTLFMLVIDICHHEESASKRGLLKSFVLDEASLRQNLEEPAVIPAAEQPEVQGKFSGDDSPTLT
jgi:hypothetical protein